MGRWGRIRWGPGQRAPGIGGARPTAHDWSGYGDQRRLVAGEDGAGWETPSSLIEKARGLGLELGVTRVPAKEALADDARAKRYIKGAVGVRTAVRTQAAVDQIGGAYRRSATARSRKKGAEARTTQIRQRLSGLKRDALPGAERRVGEVRGRLETARRELMKKPRLLRGYFENRRPVYLAGAAVVSFDGFVLHGALASSGLDAVTVWGTTVTVPIAIAAANHAFGVLSGAIGLATPSRHRLRMASVLFVSGFGAMITAFILLMVFRADAASSTNQALELIAKGRVPTHLGLFISPIWMGPLQVGGSLAAISLSAFWTMAKEGREHSEMFIAPAETEYAKAVSELNRLRALIASTEVEIENAITDSHDVEADGSAALAEIEVVVASLEAAVKGEERLGSAAVGYYESSYTYHDMLYRNGGVWRMATPSRFNRLLRRWRTPGPTDIGAEEELVERRRQAPRPGWRPGGLRFSARPTQSHGESNGDRHTTV